MMRLKLAYTTEEPSRLNSATNLQTGQRSRGFGVQEEPLLFSSPLVRQGTASQRSRWQPPEATLWRLWVPTVSCSLMPCLCPSHPQGLTNSSSHLLEEKLLHHVVQSPVQRGVVEQRRRRAKPAVKMNDLVVRIDVVILRNLLHPAHHHALQNPAGEQRPVSPPPCNPEPKIFKRCLPQGAEHPLLPSKGPDCPALKAGIFPLEYPTSHTMGKG